MLQWFKIETLADVRHLPGSRMFPQFNKEDLSVSLSPANIDYLHLPDLGRRKLNKESKNTAWKHTAFRSFADYMETEDFNRGIDRLQAAALEHSKAFMCSEAVWQHCRRSLISDPLQIEGWIVMHIMGVGKAVEHPYTATATVYGVPHKIVHCRMLS